jgi:hypothetical protein
LPKKRRKTGSSKNGEAGFGRSDVEEMFVTAATARSATAGEVGKAGGGGGGRSLATAISGPPAAPARDYVGRSHPPGEHQAGHERGERDRARRERAVGPSANLDMLGRRRACLGSTIVSTPSVSVALTPATSTLSRKVEAAREGAVAALDLVIVEHVLRGARGRPGGPEREPAVLDRDVHLLAGQAALLCQIWAARGVSESRNP